MDEFILWIVSMVGGLIIAALLLFGSMAFLSHDVDVPCIEQGYTLKSIGLLGYSYCFEEQPNGTLKEVQFTNLEGEWKRVD